VITKPLTAQNCADILDGFIPGHHQPKKDSDKDRYLSDMPDNEACLFNLTEFPSLDIEEGIKTTGSEDSLAEMLSFLMNDSLPKDLAQMKKAHDAHDWNKTQQLAHKIKGGAVYVGTTKIKMSCQYLERYWKIGKHDLLEKLYQQILTVVDESIKEINSWLNNH
ncbi:Hpt domain-containing protein, partial [Legionella drozanskii]|uniref:Hpt domain-containing protein n=1 Tax=Legionella drozanskii TaxID=96228 RepID=UPI00104100AC